MANLFRVFPRLRPSEAVDSFNWYRSFVPRKFHSPRIPFGNPIGELPQRPSRIQFPQRRVNKFVQRHLIIPNEYIVNTVPRKRRLLARRGRLSFRVFSIFSSSEAPHWALHATLAIKRTSGVAELGPEPTYSRVDRFPASLCFVTRLLYKLFSYLFL